MNVNHLRKHLGELPDDRNFTNNESMVIHDLKIIATSMGVVQYACLLVGCFTVSILHIVSMHFPTTTGMLSIILVSEGNLDIFYRNVCCYVFSTLFLHRQIEFIQ